MRRNLPFLEIEGFTGNSKDLTLSSKSAKLVFGSLELDMKKFSFDYNILVRVTKGGAMKKRYSKPQIVQKEKIEVLAGPCSKLVVGCGGGPGAAS